ncbi:hypothetical protein PAXRUDRAFT_179303 [Paxillus rubicundulus Ve08.2h10]|uniref:Uncharacterized protein n=1 Tax=Paxillus rubicundulus Ve08.2h10 TaxID=930991 RepID=A0A0D0CQJ5_9AGAM|nr:hypothetical protein PAXRUDRAFT_179303 [Paxillus rubicundulus Ve08.2h10]
MINALLATLPNLDQTRKGLPYGTADLGDGYALLRKRDKHYIHPPDGTAQPISNFMGPDYAIPHIKRWARLLLPNGHIAKWTHRQMDTSPNGHIAKWTHRQMLNGDIHFAEALYYTRLAVEGNMADAGPDQNWRFVDITIIHLFSVPDPQLLAMSEQTVASCLLLDEIQVIDIKAIISIVGMIPHTPRLPSGVTEDRFFLWERPGLDLTHFAVPHAAHADEDEDNNAGDIE